MSQPEMHLSVSEMCSIAGVSRSGYYAWVKATPAREAQEEQDRKDFDIILEACRWRGYSKGARGIYMRFLHMDPPVVMNVKKISRLITSHRFIEITRNKNLRQSMSRKGNCWDNAPQESFFAI